MFQPELDELRAAIRHADDGFKYSLVIARGQRDRVCRESSWQQDETDLDAMCDRQLQERVGVRDQLIEQMFRKTHPASPLEPTSDCEAVAYLHFRAALLARENIPLCARVRTMFTPRLVRILPQMGPRQLSFDREQSQTSLFSVNWRGEWFDGVGHVSLLSAPTYEAGDVVALMVHNSVNSRIEVNFRLEGVAQEKGELVVGNLGFDEGMGLICHG